MEGITSTGEPIAAIDGKELEAAVVARLAVYKARGAADIGRYGVQATVERDPTSPTGVRYQLHRSLPDFEGVLPDGRQLMWDCKVCSQASFSLSAYVWGGTKSKAKSRQLRHMLDRSMYRVPCYFCIHWNARSGKTFSTDPETWLFPVCIRMPFWEAFLRSEEKSIQRQHCIDFGTRVYWNKLKKLERSYRPDVLEAIQRDMRERGLE